MLRTSYNDRRKLSQLPREELARHQLARLNELLTGAVPHNRFYAEKFARVELPLASLDAPGAAAVHVQGGAGHRRRMTANSRPI